MIPIAPSPPRPPGTPLDVGPFDRLSSTVIDRELLDFQEARENWKKPAGVDVFVIAGHGNHTLTELAEFKLIIPGRRASRAGPALEPRVVQALELGTGNGDGTVPLESAETVEVTEPYYADLNKLKEDHGSQLANSEIQKQVLGLLFDGPGIYGNFIQKQRPLILFFPSIRWITFSPVRLRVFDSKGNHTGLLPNGQIEKGIPGSLFEQIEEQQFVVVPEGDTYRVLTEGIGTGDLTLWQTDLDGTGLPLRTLEWNSVPVQPGSLNTLVTQFGAQNPVLSVDLDGNGVPNRRMRITKRFSGGGGPALLADLNGDGRVNTRDIAVVKASFGASRNTRRYNPVADVNRDGIVDVRDLAWVSQASGQGRPSGTK